MGDALIFMTKAALLCTALVLAAWLYVVQTSSAGQYRLSQEYQRGYDDGARTLTVYQNRLVACVKATGFDVHSVPDPPPGFVLD